MLLVVSRTRAGTRLVLRGAVSVDGHAAAEAAIVLGGGLVSFSGSISKPFGVGDARIERPALDVRIYTTSSSSSSQAQAVGDGQGNGKGDGKAVGKAGRGIEVQFSGVVTLADKHRFDVAVYLSKRAGTPVEYTVYGAYKGALHIHDLTSALGETELLRGVCLKHIAVCVSTMQNPGAFVKDRPPGYEIGRGLTLYAKVQVPAVRDVLGLVDETTLLLCAAYKPATADGGSSELRLSLRVPGDDVVSLEAPMGVLGDAVWDFFYCCCAKEQGR
jgi:hypothetical protein